MIRIIGARTIGLNSIQSCQDVMNQLFLPTLLIVCLLFEGETSRKQEEGSKSV